MMEQDKDLVTQIYEIDAMYESKDEIIIYGAGKVCCKVLDYILKQKGELNKIYCIMVSDKSRNPDEILGIPVCSKESVRNKAETTILIATFENAHNSIKEWLLAAGYQNIRLISNAVYAELRKRNPDYMMDIMQNTMGLKSDLRIILNKLNRLEKCIQNGVNNYEELLTKEQYKMELCQWYRNAFREELDLDNPVTYNQKIQWMKLYGMTPLITELVDKYTVREWVSKKIGEKYLIPLLGVWDHFDEIEFEKLPKQFVLKCNHGSGWNDIITNKDAWNKYAARKKFDRWMNMNFAYHGGLELQYKDIVPRIMAEKYMVDSNGEFNDYKFMCFDGKVKLFWVDTDRATDHRRDVFDAYGNHTDYTILYPMADKVPQLPDNINEMIRLAEILSEGFAHVRVDLYSVDGSIYFGEMTFTSGNGGEKMKPIELGYLLGDMFELPDKKE